ncbi:5-formyltetrahydrofolate cyclo-ligase [Lacimicrobium sp. SS2-24]|uniref:5-formyltetrahydrofolate cyclo-ligase n=1 Tax=Lacimicrobium sp. SS2-24 TaxID=2005569 RepID=UPI000B4AD26E|nr:5-formyltetrahydrofolate cyclo-ligase [Lacimicrobium sp. SS2-24]
MQENTPGALRQRYRQRRRELTTQQQQQASRAILTQCLTQTEFIDAQYVACYLAEDGELDPIEIIHYAWEQGKHVCLPVLHPFARGHLLFVSYTPDSPMHANRFNIPEPRLECSLIVPLHKLDIIFAPLVAFDGHGNRLGMGGGFYDRTLAPLYRDHQPLTTTMVGLAHDCQQTDLLRVQPWDLPMHRIITPSSIHIPEQSSARNTHGSK